MNEWLICVYRTQLHQIPSLLFDKKKPFVTVRQMHY